MLVDLIVIVINIMFSFLVIIDGKIRGSLFYFSIYINVFSNYYDNE